MNRAKNDDTVAPAIPADVRELLSSPNYLHLATLRADGSSRSWVVWVGIEGERLLICTDDSTWKAKDMRRDPRVSASIVDLANPYRMAAIQGRVVEVRPDNDCRYMDPISMKYTSAPFPYRGPGRVCFVIEVLSARARSLDWLSHRPQITGSRLLEVM
jgi:PPOX class probable F420-dependent enzyme